MSYQSIDSIGSSDSQAKLAALALPDLLGRSFLDVGCNEGFFCGAAHAAGAAEVFGVDADAPSIASARILFPSVNFSQDDWDSFLDKNKRSYDVILCSSALHYAEDQELFLEKLVAALESNGMIVLECGIAEGAGETIIYDRWDGPRKYFTREGMEALLRKKELMISRITPSVLQAGDEIPRFVLHLRHRRKVLLVNFDSPGHGKTSISEGLGAVATHISIDNFVLAYLEETPNRFLKSLHNKIDQFWGMAISLGISETLLDLIYKRVEDVQIAYLEGFIPDSVIEKVMAWATEKKYIIYQLSLKGGVMPARSHAAVVPINALGKLYFISGVEKGFVDNIELIRHGNAIQLVISGWYRTEVSASEWIVKFANDHVLASTVAKMDREDVERFGLGFIASFDLTEVQTQSLNIEARMKRPIYICVGSDNRTFYRLAISSLNLSKLEHIGVLL